MYSAFKLILDGFVDQAEAQFTDPKSGPVRKAWILEQLKALLDKSGLPGFVNTILYEFGKIGLEWAVGRMKAADEAARAAKK